MLGYTLHKLDEPSGRLSMGGEMHETSKPQNVNPTIDRQTEPWAQAPFDGRPRPCQTPLLRPPSTFESQAIH